MKKLLLGLGALASVVTPIVAVVGCGIQSETGDELSKLKEDYKSRIGKYAADDKKEGLIKLVDALETKEEAILFAVTNQDMVDVINASGTKVTTTTIAGEALLQALKLSKNMDTAASYVFGENLGAVVAAVINAKDRGKINDGTSIHNWGDVSLRDISLYINAFGAMRDAPETSALTDADVTALMAVYTETLNGTNLASAKGEAESGTLISKVGVKVIPLSPAAVDAVWAAAIASHPPVQELDKTSTTAGEALLQAIKMSKNMNAAASYVFGENLGAVTAAVINAKKPNTISDISKVPAWGNVALSDIRLYNNALDGIKGTPHIVALTDADVTALMAVYTETLKGTNFENAKSEADSVALIAAVGAKVIALDAKAADAVWDSANASHDTNLIEKS